MAGDIKDFHWIIDMLSSIDVGITAIDRDYSIQTWNNFMHNHSGFSFDQVYGKNIFEIFPEVPQDWFTRKVESVFLLQNQAFSTWKQRPYLFKFKDYRPISGTSEFMYQNVTFIPLVSPDTSVNHVGLNIFDVTDIAVSELNLEKANLELSRLSRTDGLTKLNNRTYWEECLATEFSRNIRTHIPVSLILLDIDHFKKVNDSYGHLTGDEVLRHLSVILTKSIRSIDTAGRYGGEEFAIILPGSNASNAKIFAERLRKAIEAHQVNFNQQSLRFTISLGIAELDESIANHKAWIECADTALYESKEKGRNRSTIFKGTSD